MKFKEKGLEIGSLVEEKNKAYGDAFAKTEQIIKVLYPNGIRPEQYRDLLGICRVLDKMFRIANNKDAFAESPWKDIAGYGILGDVYADEDKE